MGRASYLLILLGCLVVTTPLELILGARVYARFTLAARAMAPVAAAYIAWDLVGIWRHHWDYAPHRVIGVWLGPVPLEELLFFVVVPLCGLLTYGAVGTVLALARRLSSRSPKEGHHA